MLGNHPRKDESFKINQKSKQSMFLIYFDYLIIFIKKFPMGRNSKKQTSTQADSKLIKKKTIDKLK